MILSAEQRREIKEAIDRATRAGLRPARRDARPGFIANRVGGVHVVNNYGREITYPTLEEQEARVTHRPRILRALNG